MLCLAILACLPAFGGEGGAAAGDAEEAIKAAFVYNFTRFVRWPEADSPPLDRAFVIAVAGAPAMATRLAALERRGREVDGLPIRVETVRDPAAVPPCSILFIGAAAVPHLATILRQTAERPVLVIGDAPGLARRGAAIDFFLQRHRVRFAINPAALRKAGLEAEAQLYDVARIVE